MGENALTEPNFRVIGDVPLPVGESNRVVLATLQFIQPSPEDVTLFYIHPAPNATVPGSPSYSAAGQPLNSRALVLSSGDESEPVAGVGPGPVGVGMPAPARAVLWPPYPNPFNPETTLSFDLARPGAVRLELFDLAGRRVRTLCAEALGAGAHQRRWDGRDETGRAAPSGAYYARLAVDGETQMRKLSLVR